MVAFGVSHTPMLDTQLATPALYGNALSIAEMSVAGGTHSVEIRDDFAARGGGTQARSKIHSVADDSKVHSISRTYGP